VVARTALLFVIVCGILFAVYIQLQEYQINNRVLAAQSDRNEELRMLFELKNFWQDKIDHSPTYRDGYVQMAVVYYRLGDAENSKKLIEKVFQLDPNYELPATLTFLRSVAPLAQ
jgi:hypothetical protein